MSFSGESWSTRVIADPYFTQPQAAELVRSYLDGHDPEDPSVSPLHADLKGLAPIRVHVGNVEVLLSRCTQIADFELEGHFTAVKSRTTKTSLRINRG